MTPHHWRVVRPLQAVVVDVRREMDDVRHNADALVEAIRIDAIVQVQQIKDEIDNVSATAAMLQIID